MAKKTTPLTNSQMCEIVTLRRESREQVERIKELEKMLSRSVREIETISAQYDDNGSKYLVDNIKRVLEE